MEKVVVGMSGGVDSSVAAYLLKEQGYEVIGVTMQIWQKDSRELVQENGGCCGLDAVEDARRVAAALDIPYYVMNFRDEFQSRVIDYFVKEYQNGRTPNPCIACNRYVKWESLLTRSLKIGADYIATGHYARVAVMPNGRYALKRSAAAAKDQTYALYNLTQEQLSRTKMPVGEYSKSEIRDIADKLGLFVADKPDSQEICFVPDQDYAKFIEEYTGKQCKPGNFVSVSGEIIGRHKGLIHYTIGQRKGLGLSMGKPVFVKEIRPTANEVVIGSDSDIYTNVLYGSHVSYMGAELFDDTVTVTAKIRYNHTGAPCRLYNEPNGVIRCEFLEPQRAVTPGQAVVFYQDDIVLGGAIISGNTA